MTTKEKSIQITEFSGKKGITEITTQDAYDLAVAENSKQDKGTVTVGQMNGVAYEDIVNR